MIAERLRKAVLQAAFEGKLTERLLEDESGDKLISEIKSKFNIKHKLDNCNINCDLFDVPNNWSWATIGEVTTNNGQKKPDKKFTYIDIGSINNKKKILEDNLNILKPNEAPSRARKIVKNFDVIYSTVRPYLMNLAIINREIKPEPIVSTGFAVFKTINEIMSNYVYYYLQSPFFNNYANSSDNSKGVAYPAINDKKLLNAPIPIPPLAEQKRIVEKLEILLAEIDKLEQDEKALKELEHKFPVRLKKSLLKSAIGGSFSKINLEYENKVDKLKYQNNESLNEVESLLGKINHNWIVTNLKQIADISTGRKDANHAKQNGIYRFYTCAKEYFMSDTFSFEGESLILPGNGANVGQVYRYSGKFEAYQRTYIIQVKSNFYQYIDMNYLEYLFHAYWGEYNKDKMFGSATPYIKLGNLVNFPVVIPPIDEQKRIVEKLDKLFAIDLLNI